MTSQQSLLDLQGHIHHETLRRTAPVRHVMTWLVDHRNLEAAWDRVRHSDGADTPGMDGVTCHDIERDVASWLKGIADAVYKNRFTPAPPRFVAIAKPGAGSATRRIGILTVSDRVVHAAVKQILEPIVEPTFHARSFGFRPGRSVHAALSEAIRLLSRHAPRELPRLVTAQLDIRDCFPSLDHTMLMRTLQHHVRDPAFLALLRQLLIAGTGPKRGPLRRRRGVVQGSVLAPLLCNLGLHRLDADLERLRVRSHGGVVALRYADDLLLLARDAKHLRQAIRTTRRTLWTLRLRLRAGKCTHRRVRDGFEWLGLRVEQRPASWFGTPSFGCVIPADKVSDLLRTITEATSIPARLPEDPHRHLSITIGRLSRSLRGWHEAHRFADNAPHVARAIDQHCYREIKSLVLAMTGETWDQARKNYRTRLPRGFHAWQIGATRLVPLAALPPRHPGRIMRKPAWIRPPTPAPLSSTEQTDDVDLQARHPLAIASEA